MQNKQTTNSEKITIIVGVRNKKNIILCNLLYNPIVSWSLCYAFLFKNRSDTKGKMNAGGNESL